MHGRKEVVVGRNRTRHTANARTGFSATSRFHVQGPARLRHAWLLVVLIAVVPTADRQGATARQFSAGIETDALPLATGGYLAALWAGTPRVQVRALVARVNMPDLARPDAFDRQRIDATALLLDVHPLGAASPWWVAGGLVRWDGRIRDASTGISENYDVWLLNGSLGWHRDIWRQLYVRPWTGLSLRAGGDRDIRVGDSRYDPRLLNPELSVKMGWRFTRE